MLEKMFTTKMSMDKEKLQNRFSKISSKNGTTSRIIAIVLFTFIVISIMAVSVYVAVNKFQDKTSENPDINALYKLKETYIGDAPTVRKIVDLTNITDYKVESIELKTDAQPYRLIVNFKVDNRAHYRTIDENLVNRMSGLIFSLIQNNDEILYRFYDDYSKNIDDAFYSAYYNKQNLCERIGNTAISPEYINSSAKDITTFEKYYNTLMSTEVATANNDFFEHVYEFIGDDYEIVLNSGVSTNVMIDNLPESEVAILERILNNKTIGKYYGTGISTQLIIYDIRNFKTDEYKKCAFLYHIHPDMGLVIVGESFITDSESDELNSFIIRLQSHTVYNAENMSYAELQSLQAQVDNGHFPWRLDYEQVIKEFLSGKNIDSKTGQITELAGGADGISLTYSVGENEYTQIFSIELFKPIDKTDSGIWVVRVFQDITAATIKNVQDKELLLLSDDNVRFKLNADISTIDKEPISGKEGRGDGFNWRDYSYEDVLVKALIGNDNSTQIIRISTASNKYKTPRDIKVGDSLKKLQEKYPKDLTKGLFNEACYVYVPQGIGVNRISFYLENDIITMIVIENGIDG